MGGQYDFMPPTPNSRPPNPIETPSPKTAPSPTSTNWEKAPTEVRLESVTKTAFKKIESPPEIKTPSLKGRSITSVFSNITNFVKESAIGRFFGNLAAKIGSGKDVGSGKVNDLSFHVTEDDPYIASVIKNNAPQEPLKREVNQDPEVLKFKSQVEELKEGARDLINRADRLAKNGSPSVVEAHNSFKEAVDNFNQKNDRFQKMNPSNEEEYEIFGFRRAELEDEYGRVEMAFRNLEDKVKQ